MMMKKNKIRGNQKELIKLFLVVLFFTWNAEDGINITFPDIPEGRFQSRQYVR